MNRLERGIWKSLTRKGAAAGGVLTLQSTLGWGRDTDANSALKVSAVSACVELRSNAIAMLPSFIMDTETKAHLDDHYLGGVLWRRPNPIMTPLRFKQLTETQVLLRGDSYVWIYRDGAGRAVELLPIPDGWCQRVFNRSTERWEYRAQDPKSGRGYTFDPIDILHYDGLTLDGVNSVSVLECARRTIETAGLMEEYQRATYRNGGRPSGVLEVASDLSGTVEVPQSDGTKKRMPIKEVVRAEWERYNSGADNHFRTAILDHGLTYKPIAVSNADAQFVESKNITVEDICRFFSVPAYKLGIGKQSYNSNEQNNIEWVTTTLQPRITAREQEETWKLLTYTEQVKQHLRVRHNMSAILRADAKTRAEVENIYRMNGTYSVNDICDLEDRPHVPGGDTRYARLDSIPLEFFNALSLARNAPAEKNAGKEE